MSLLRILRNVAVLVILAVAVLSLNPRPMAAQSSCLPLGSACHLHHQCCNSYCGAGRCCLFLHNAECTSSEQCCGTSCISGRCN
jgi:hypothetical protein